MQQLKPSYSFSLLIQVRNSCAAVTYTTASIELDCCQVQRRIRYSRLRSSCGDGECRLDNGASSTIAINGVESSISSTNPSERFKGDTGDAGAVFFCVLRRLHTLLLTTEFRSTWMSLPNAFSINGR